jgi:hypothetical protein
MTIGRNVIVRLAGGGPRGHAPGWRAVPTGPASHITLVP